LEAKSARIHIGFEEKRKKAKAKKIALNLQLLAIKVGGQV
jgi:hypothetical protein